MSSRVTDRTTGFSLVELLVTVFIAGVVFAAMVPVFVSSQKQQTRDTVRTVALAVAQDRLEKIRDLDYNRITLYATTPWSSTATGQAKYCNARGTLGNPSATYNLSDPGETEIGSTGFGPVYRYQTSSEHYRDLTVTYTLELKPGWTAADGTEQFKEVTVRVSWAGTDPGFVELKTQIYKQFAGPIITDFRIRQHNIDVASELDNSPVTLRATVSPADAESMAGGGLVQFSVLNAQGTLINRQIVTAAAGQTVFEAIWDPASAPDGLYSFKAVAFNKDSFQGNSWQLSFILEKGAPSAPVATATAGNGTVSLSWVSTPPISAGEYYQVLRSTPDEAGPYTEVVPYTTSTSHSESGLTNGTTYWYKVAVYDAKGNSAVSAAVSATPQEPEDDKTGPLPPSGLSAAKAGPNMPTIVVSWTTVSVDNPPPAAPSGMSHYVVQRASDSAFTADVTTLDNAYPFGTTPPYNLSYSDSGAGYSATWYYRIAGVDNDGNQGAWSAVVGATTDAPLVRSLSVTRATNKYYVWVQAKAPPYLWYTATGTGSPSRPAGVYGNKNSTTVWNNLPAGLYTVIYSSSSSGTPQTGAKDVDLTAGNGTVSL